MLGRNPKFNDDPSVTGNHDDGRNGKQKHKTIHKNAECGQIVFLFTIVYGDGCLVVGVSHFDCCLQWTKINERGCVCVCAGEKRRKVKQIGN